MVGGRRLTAIHPDTQENGNEFCLELLADVTLFSTLIAQNLVFAIWGLCWYNFVLFCFVCSFVCLFVCLFVLRYMHCTHTTAHSTVLSSIPTAWLKAQAGLNDLAQVTV